MQAWKAHVLRSNWQACRKSSARVQSSVSEVRQVTLEPLFWDIGQDECNEDGGSCGEDGGGEQGFGEGGAGEDVGDGGSGCGKGSGGEAVLLFLGRPRRQTVLAFKGRRANHINRLPPGLPPPDPLPGPPGPGDTETRVARMTPTSGADAIFARRASRKRVMTAESDGDEAEHGSDAEGINELLEICRRDRVADGKGRRRGAKLALAATTSTEAELLPAMAGRRNSLVGAAAYRDPKNVVAELCRLEQ